MCVCVCVCVFYFIFLGPHPQHMEVAKFGDRIKALKLLQLLACTTATATRDPSCVYDLHHSLWQHWIPNPLSKARDQTYNLMVQSQILLCHNRDSFLILILIDF